MTSRFRELMTHGIAGPRRATHALYAKYKDWSEKRKGNKEPGDYATLQAKLQAVNTAIHDKRRAIATVEDALLGTGDWGEAVKMPSRREKIYAGFSITSTLSLSFLIGATITGFSTLTPTMFGLLVGAGVFLIGLMAVASIKRASAAYFYSVRKFMQETLTNLERERTELVKRMDALKPQT